MQHSHSSHDQKTTSNRLKINWKGKLRFHNGSPQEGAMYINLWQNFGGVSWKCQVFIFLFSQNIDCFEQTIRFIRLLEFIKLYEQNPLRIFFFSSSFFSHYLPKLYFGFNVVLKYLETHELKVCESIGVNYFHLLHECAFPTFTSTCQ